MRFRNAYENNIVYLNRLDTLDYLYWSDTEIRVSATSYVKLEGKSGIGTGKFIVKNKWGDTTMTNSELFVKYAIENKYQTYQAPINKVFKKRVNLIDDTIGYVFAFNSAIFNDPIRKAVTEKAIRDWVCQTGVNFKIFYHDTIQVSNSFISYGNNSTNTTDQIAYTIPSIVYNCFQDTLIRHEIFATSFEIEMNSDTQWDYDTTGTIASNKRSYYSVLLHELGHAHQLDHILNDNSELMRPSIAPEQYRTFSPNLFLGTDDVFNYNQNHIYNNCNYSPMVFGNPFCSTNSISENEINNNILIYPNPFKNQINIELLNDLSEGVSIIIYNIIGEIVFSSKYSTNQKIINVDMSKLSVGSYILTTKTNERIISKKIIKTE